MSREVTAPDQRQIISFDPSVKDIIIRGGENIVRISSTDCYRFETQTTRFLIGRSLSGECVYDDERVGQAVVVGVPDVRLGELPAAVYFKPGKTATEQDLIALTRERCVFSFPSVGTPYIEINYYDLDVRYLLFQS